MVRNFEPFIILTNQLVTYTSKAKAIITPNTFINTARRTGKLLLQIAAAQRGLSPVICEKIKTSGISLILKSNSDLINKGTSVIDETKTHIANLYNPQPTAQLIITTPTKRRIYFSVSIVCII